MKLNFSNHLLNIILIILIFIISSNLAFSQSDYKDKTESVSETKSDSTKQNEEDYIPTVTITDDLLETESNDQDVSGMLQASGDVFNSVAGYNFRVARYRSRGYGSEEYTMFLNGVRFNDPESGYSVYSLWSGLNDATRNQTAHTGITPCEYHFSGIGGYSNINATARVIRKGTKISYSLTNRSYRHRTMVTHSTGMMDNGWAVAISASSRYSKEGYVDGTYYDSYGYFLSLEKKLNQNQILGLTVLGIPTIRAKQGIATQEAYDLASSNYYNPYWGYQNGIKRNIRINNSHQPIVMLNHYWTKSDKTKINSAIYYKTGKNGNTNINWYDAKDPRPDYYKYLPSYYKTDQPAEYERITNLWETDVNTRQINFDALYNANYKNLYTVTDAEGVAGNNITGNRSKYIIEEYRSDRTLIGLNSVISSKFNEKLKGTVGINYSMHKSKNFKVMKDLLGGDFWVDVDQFAEQDFADDNTAQNDLNNINNVVYIDEKFGYDYDINVNSAETFAQAEYTLKKMDIYTTIGLSHSSFWRTGNMINGRFPDNSYGKSGVLQFLDYGLKGGVLYKLTGRHFISINGAYITRQPFILESFISPKVNDNVIKGIKSTSSLSGDINYIARLPKLKARATFFYTEIIDQTWSKSFYHDEYRTFVNYTMTGVDQLFTGVEIGLEYKISPSFEATGAFAKGDYIWNSRPSVYITRDNSSEVLAENKILFLQNYKIGGSPQTASTIGLKYNNSHYWFVGINFNYFDDFYLEFNGDRRSAEALSKYIISDPQWNQILEQSKFDSGYTIDMKGGKSWRVKGKYIALFLSVSNLLNNQQFRTWGFEQLRYDTNDIDKFPPKYSYMYGLNYFAMFTFSF